MTAQDKDAPISATAEPVTGKTEILTIKQSQKGINRMIMNTVYLDGNLAKKPEIKKGDKTTFAKFVVNHDGPTEKQNASVEIVTFGKLAEDIADLRKGQTVAVRGRFQTGTYKRQDGKSFTKTSIIADGVDFS